MYADYVVWCGESGESGGPVDDLFNDVGEDPNGYGMFLGIGQHNVTYRKNVALQCGCSLPVASDGLVYAVGIAQLAHTVGGRVHSLP